MGGTASIRIVPIHSKTTIQRTELHNERKEGDLTGKHIDKNKIIHRDINPRNIFKHGSRFKLGDFGIAI